MKRKIVITSIVVGILVIFLLVIRYYKLISYIHVEPMPRMSERIEHYKILKNDTLINWIEFANYYGFDFVFNVNNDNKDYNLFILKNNEDEIVNYHNNIEYIFVKIDSVSLNDGRRILFKDIFSLHDFISSSKVDFDSKRAYIKDIGTCFFINSDIDSLFLFFIPKNDKTKILLVKNGKENCYILKE